MRGVKIIGIIIISALILIIGIHFLLRTYISSRTSETVKTSLESAYGDTVTFDALMFNFLSSQIEIDNFSYTFSHPQQDAVYILNAETIVLHIPGRDLLNLTASPAYDFKISQGTIMLDSPSFQIILNKHSAPITVTSPSAHIEFVGPVYREHLALLSQSSFRDIITLFSKISFSAQDMKVHAPEHSAAIHELSQLFSDNNYSPTEASALLLSLAPEGSVPSIYQITLPYFFSQTDTDLLYRISKVLGKFLPDDSGELIPSTCTFAIHRRENGIGEMDIQGSLVNRLGDISIEGLLHDQKHHTERLSLEHLDIYIEGLHPEITSLLGDSQFFYSFGYE